VNEPGVVFPRPIDENYRSGADRNQYENQYEKARRKQQDLSNCAPSPRLRRSNRLAK
jgi:hypothetical protein